MFKILKLKHFLGQVISVAVIVTMTVSPQLNLFSKQGCCYKLKHLKYSSYIISVNYSLFEKNNLMTKKRVRC